VLPNGQAAIIDMAVRALDDPLVARHRRTLVLGALREDVGYIPGAGIIFQCLSLTHFYKPGLPGGLVPFLTLGPRRRANTLLAAAVREHAAGRTAAAFVRLGHAAHLLVDMACPVHSHRTVHMIDDPYEWYVEGHAAALRALPVPAWADRPRASDLVEDLARFAQAFAPDGTHSPWGRLLRRAGARTALTMTTIAGQARQLIPAAAGATAALLRLFLREARAA
jgi:hypothetical protein